MIYITLRKDFVTVANYYKIDGGGAGNRTRVLGSRNISFYMRSLSFGLTLIPPADRILRASL